MELELYIPHQLLEQMISKQERKNKLGILILVDREGKFIDGSGEFSGRYVKDYKDAPGYVDVNVDISV
jgi:isoleucyl-tRNA synthetase